LYSVTSALKLVWDGGVDYKRLCVCVCVCACLPARARMHAAKCQRMKHQATICCDYWTLLYYVHIRLKLVVVSIQELTSW